MTRIVNSIHVKAPVHDVFSYASEPNNLPEIWPSLEDVKDVKRLPNGGYAWSWDYKMAGMKFHGSSEMVEVIPDKRTVSKSKGGIDSTITWEFESEKGGTKVTAVTEYDVPNKLLTKLAKPFVVKQNENEANIILANLKARLEV